MPDTATALPKVFAQRIVVGVCDFAVSNHPSAVLSTYALGSCIAVVAYEPGLRIGGMLHFMLPRSDIAPARAARHPAMFADTGLPPFLRALAGLGAETARLQFMLAGGASVLAGRDLFRIGERNLTAALELLGHAGGTIRHQDAGGTQNRTLHLELKDGTVIVQRPHTQTRWSLGTEA